MLQIIVTIFVYVVLFEGFIALTLYLGKTLYDFFKADKAKKTVEKAQPPDDTH